MARISVQPRMNTDRIILALIVTLALGGLADALYFTFAYYGRVKKSRWIPEILCAREGSSCVTVVQTRYGRVFGVPNSLLGTVYYLILIAWPFVAGRQHGSLFGRSHGLGYEEARAFLLFASAGTVILGGYLIYALRRKLGTHCPLCYAAHAINTILFVLLVLL
jgi:uncharacterized membrane protein